MHLQSILPLLIVLPLSLLSETTEALKVLSSELDILCQDDTKQDACSQLSSFELAQVESEEESGFIICHQDSSDLSGGERKHAILNLARENGLDLNLSDDAIYNREGAYCAYGYMTHSTAALLTGMNDGVITTEALSTMAKIRVGAFGESSAVSDRDPEVIYVDLCPGIVDSDAAAARLATSFVDNARDDLETGATYFQALESTSDTKDRFDARLEDASSSDFDCLNIINEAVIELNFISSMHSYQISYMVTDDGDDSKICHDFFIVALATQTEVCSVEKHARINVFNDNAQWILQSGVENENGRPFFDNGITGTGQVVQVSDSGLDTNNCYFYDSSPGELKDGTVQSERRKVIQYVPFQDAVSNTFDHGTHCVGTVLGRKSSNGINTDEIGMADGVARDAKVAFFDIGFGTGCCAVPGTSTLFSPGRNAGANLHSASWGSAFSPYPNSVRDTDKYHHDNEDFVMFVAAGNSGTNNAMNTIGNPAAAKNVIAVGAGESLGSDICCSMMGPNYLAYFSSRGPTSDGRIKPDIVAPGYNILSAGAQPGQIGECDPENRPSYPFPTSGMGVAFKAGTSMACPGAAGAGALVRQYFMEGWFPTGAKVTDNELTPSGSLIKAVMINGAEDMTGVRQLDGSVTPVAPYDNNVGFGRVNLIASLPLLDHNDFRAFMVDKQPMAQGGIDEYDFFVNTNGCSGDQFSATIVWADKEGTSGCTHCLVNDLDLEVVKNDDPISYPNGLNTKDDRNNVERVRISVSQDDIVHVRVKGANLGTNTQNYSLIVTGCILPSLLSSAPATMHPSEVPTLSPTALTSMISQAPSMIPSANCENFRLELKTDRWPDETTWNVSESERIIYSLNNDTTIYANNTVYIHDMCLPVGSDIRFTIFDAYGDGICCGEGQGYYKLYLYGDLIKEGGQFGFQESFVFHVNSTTASPSSDSETTSASPSEFPTMTSEPQTMAPSISSSEFPTMTSEPQTLAPSISSSEFPTMTSDPQTLAPSIILSEFPTMTSEPLTLAPSISPSSEAEEPPSSVQITVPSVLTIDNVELPEDPEQLNTLVGILEDTISETLSNGADLDVIVTAVNGNAINTAPSKTATVSRQSNELKVDFDIVQTVECADLCEAELGSAEAIANQTTATFVESLESGSFVGNLTANAADAGVTSMENATATAEDFVPEEPKIDVVTDSLPPSMAPSSLEDSGECGHEHHMDLLLKTDGYGGETSWMLRKDVGSNNFDEVVHSGSDYASHTEYIIHKCLSEGRYEFTISDAYGDGICCDYGVGSYGLYLDGDMLHEGGNFAASEATVFDAVPSSQPSLEPSVAPSDIASTVPTEVPSMDPTWLSDQPSVDSGTLMPSSSHQPTIEAGGSPDEKLLIMFLRALVAFINTFLATISKNLEKLGD